jgi:hypothetical protein
VLSFGWSKGDELPYEINLRQEVTLGVEYHEIQPFDRLKKDVGRLVNLMALCLDVPVAVDSFTLKRPDIQVDLLSGGSSGIEQAIEFVASPISYEDPRERESLQAHQMLIGYSDLGRVSTVAKWLDSSERFQFALDSIMSTKHESRMFIENRFLNILHAAESFHRTMQGGARMANEVFEGLLESYVKATPDELQKWITGKLKFGNEPSLTSRLRQLAARSGGATRDLIGDRDRWSYVLSCVRNELTHLGAGSRGFSGGDLFFLSESVYAVVRICMLLESGVSITVLSEKVKSSEMMWYRGRLQASIDRVRENFNEN